MSTITPKITPKYVNVEKNGDIYHIPINETDASIAIVVSGDEAPRNILAGQYLFIKNHSTLPSGGYHATLAIGSGYTISSANVAADEDGIVNGLNRALSEVNDLTKDADCTGDIVTFEDGAEDVPLKMLKIGFDPVQDLHGYDHPWPEGGGKNIIGATLATLQSLNTSGTWVGETYTINGVAFACSFFQGYLTEINASGTATDENAVFSIMSYVYPENVSYILNGGIAGGGSKKWLLYSGGNADSYDIDGNGSEPFAYESSGHHHIAIVVYTGATINGIFHPMLRLATETDPTFEPYSNICPITGRTGVEVTRTGKNLCTTLETGSISSTTGEDSDYAVDQRLRTGWIRVKENTQYTISGTGIDITPQVYIFQMADIHAGTVISADGWHGLPYTFLTDSNTKWVRVSFRGSGNPSITPASVSNAQIEEGTTATAFEPIGAVYPITFPTSAGTVYGGELTVHSDGTGTLVVDHVFYEFDGSSDENMIIRGNQYKIIVFNQAYYADREHVISNMFSRTEITYDNDAVGVTLNNGYQIRIRYGLHTSLTEEDARAYLSNNPVQVCYERATPVTYTLTTEQVRTLLGLNHVWTNDGDIEQLTYYLNKPINTDVQELREQIVAVQNSLVAPVLSGMIADTALTANDFRIARGTLYKVTSAISSGGTLIPGTNCVATSLGEQLTALLNA